MNAARMMNRIAEASPRLKARTAGVLFLLLVLTAALTEFLLRGRLSFAADLAAGIIEVSCMIAVTVLFYDIFKPVNSRLSLLAAIFNLMGLTFELLQFPPHGVNIGLGLHGCYWILIGYLIFRSTFLPRVLGALTAIAGLCWLTFLPPSLANYLSPYNLASGLLVEGLVFLWLLVMGVNAQRWRDQARAATASIRKREPPSPAAMGSTLRRSVEREIYPGRTTGLTNFVGRVPTDHSKV